MTEHQVLWKRPLQPPQAGTEAQPSGHLGPYTRRFRKEHKSRVEVITGSRGRSGLEEPVGRGQQWLRQWVREAWNKMGCGSISGGILEL